MPTDRSHAVQIKGLADFQRELKALDTRLPRELKRAGDEAAGVIVPEAQRRARGLGSTAAHVVDSIKAASQQRNAAIALGGPRFPMALGAEFGGQRRPTTQQFTPWTGKTGRFFWPAIRDTKDESIEVYGDALDRLFAAAFPD